MLGRQISRRCTEELFDDHAVAPLAVEPAMAPVHTDLAEAYLAAEGTAGGVLREDTRDELPNAASLALVAQSLRCGGTVAGAARFPRRVDRALAHAGVAGARAIRGDRGQGDDRAAPLDDHGWVTLAALGEQRRDLRRRAR